VTREEGEAAECALSTLDRAKPRTWTGTGSGNDLVIQRMGLDPLFHRLVLVNRDPITNCVYSIEPSTTLISLPPGVTTKAYFLNGTDITLRLPTGEPQERRLLTRDDSYAFSGSQWTGYYYGSGVQEDLSKDFGYWAYRFMKAGQPPMAQKGATAYGVVASMYDFMLVFSLWANKCDAGGHFPQYGSGPQSTTVLEYILLDEIGGNGISSFLTAKTLRRTLFRGNPG
jgi:hypothetical protein